MAFLKFTKLPRNQKFDYKPRYYDPRKEELEERLKKIDECKSGDTEKIKNRISGGFRRKYESEGTGRRTRVVRSNLILVGIIVLLGFITYTMLVVYLPRFVELLESK